MSQPSHSDTFLRIRERAYFRAMARGFSSGQELDDWCKAEQEEIEERARELARREVKLEVGMEEEARAHGNMERADPGVTYKGGSSRPPKCLAHS